MADAPIAPDPLLLLVGKGELLFNPYDANGDPTYWRHFGNVQSLEITTEDDNLDKYSAMSAPAPLYKRLPRRRDVQMRIVFDEFAADNVALALMGEVVQTTAQAATPITNEVVTASAVLGAYYQLAKFGPYTVAPVLEETVGPTTLVEGTDYRIVNEFMGIIQLLPTAVNVANGETVHADYTPTAYASGIKSIKGGSKNSLEAAFKFLADPSTGPKLHVDIWKASVTPDGAIGLISEEFASMQLLASVLDSSIAHPEAPLYRVLHVA